MDNNQLINLLKIILGVMIGVLVLLTLIFIILKIKSRTPKEKNKKEKTNNKDGKSIAKEKTITPKTYTKESIFKFMEFDKIEDDMIVQKSGKRYVMVIGCQGINYDLMSGIEKNSVEQGFIQFLNTLRYPIQIYVQTRTVNLGKSIDGYKERINNIKKEYENKQMEYNQMLRSGRYNPKEIKEENYELTRQRNLYEYGIDIVNNTEKMSLNKNILSKHYYVIISYYPEEGANSNYQKDEIQNLAFSELYTKAQSIINALTVCGINSKILDSVDLMELLYAAYNRDESEKFDLKRALNAGYEDLYSTAPDVFEKRIKELDTRIQEEATKEANDAIVETMEQSEAERRAKAKEAKMDELIDEFAKILVDDNKRLYGTDIAEGAKEKIDEKAKKRAKEKGGENNGQKETTRRTRRTTRI